VTISNNGQADMGFNKKRHCKVCGREITEQDSEDYVGMCWGCWGDQLTEESDSMFDDLM
jgi:hypothetical protein